MAEPTGVSDTSHQSSPPPWSEYPDKLRCSDNGRRLIKDFEGLRLDAYGDVTGIMTIGYGHTRNVQPGQHISEATAETYLDEDIRDCEHNIAVSVSVQLSQNQFDALCSWMFNLGFGAWQKSGALHHLNAGDYNTCISIMALYCHAGGRVVPGLQRRRLAEFDLWHKPDTEKATKP